MKKFLTILSLLSFKGLFTPIARKVLRFFLSEKNTTQIIALLGYALGFSRILSAIFGLILFYNLVEIDNLFSLDGIITAVTTFLLILRDNIVTALNKLFPDRPDHSIISKVVDYIKDIGSKGD